MTTTATKAPLTGIPAILAAASGNLVEWFDFYIYAFCSLYFAPAFFPKSDPTGQLLNTAGLFAAGFLMRPIGGWAFGRLADRHGRRHSLLLSVWLMCGGSLAICLLPTYETIGLFAPALLLLARLVQGFALGGEYGAAATYMSEVADEGRRGYHSSFQYVTLVGGQLLASLLVVLLQQTIGEDALRAGGWRIPFALGAVGALVALAVRSRLPETAPRADQEGKAGHFPTLWKSHKRAFLAVLGFTAGGSLVFYTFTTYMQKFLVNTSGLPAPVASVVMSVCLLIFMALQPVLGMLSDRNGRRTHMLVFGGLATLGTVPLLTALRATHDPLIAGLLITLALAVVSIYTSISGIVKAELFPTGQRALGVSFAYALGNAIFGGSAEYVALFAKQAGHEGAFYWYVTAMMAIFFAISLTLPRRPPYLG
jgi:MHS family dicarboxylic acid transporter PcaT-like MFS transporter